MAIGWPRPPYYGGPIVTVRGVLFVCAMVFDGRLRGFDRRPATCSWQGDLPYVDDATPKHVEDR